MQGNALGDAIIHDIGIYNIYWQHCFNARFSIINEATYDRKRLDDAHDAKLRWSPIAAHDYTDAKLDFRLMGLFPA